jgi:selenocysteine lyase/cysteine desulfurase
LRADVWARGLSERTGLACIPAVASFSGARLDVAAFAEAAHARGAPVLVDAFQAAGTYPIDVRRSDVDFLVTGVYKWLMSPVGLAFLYVRRDHHALVPTTSGWYGAETPYNFDPLDALAPDARRFQYGGASIVGCVAAAESLRLLQEVGIAKVEGRNRQLVDRVLGHAAQRKYEILTPEDARDRASIVTFRVPDLAAALDACAREKVIVNSRLGGIRVSPHFYNREADVDRLFEVLDHVAA